MYALFITRIAIYNIKVYILYCINRGKPIFIVSKYIRFSFFLFCSLVRQCFVRLFIARVLKLALGRGNYGNTIEYIHYPHNRTHIYRIDIQTRNRLMDLRKNTRCALFYVHILLYFIYCSSIGFAFIEHVVGASVCMCWCSREPIWLQMCVYVSTIAHTQTSRARTHTHTLAYSLTYMN